MSKGTPGCWELPYLWSYFHLPAGPRERSEGMNDKLFQVSPGKQAGGGGGLLGQLPQHHPGNLILEPSAKMPRALPTC